MRIAISTTLISLLTALPALSANIKHQPKPEVIHFRIVAVAEPIAISGFSPNRNVLLVTGSERKGPSGLSKVVFGYMGYEYPIPAELIDYGLVHSFTASRDLTCDETWEPFSTKTVKDATGKFISSSVLRYTVGAPAPEVSSEQVLPCYVVRERGYKGSRRLLPSAVTVSIAEAQ